jgi:hypothetical protein
VLGDHAVRTQLDAYAHWLRRFPPSCRLDATRPVPQLVEEALLIVTGREHHAPQTADGTLTSRTLRGGDADAQRG